MPSFWSRIPSGSHVLVHCLVSSVSFDVGPITWDTFGDRRPYRQWQPTWISYSSLHSTGSQTLVFVTSTQIVFTCSLPEKRSPYCLARVGNILLMPCRWQMQAPCPAAASTAWVNACRGISPDTMTSRLYFFRIYFFKHYSNILTFLEMV